MKMFKIFTTVVLFLALLVVPVSAATSDTVDIGFGYQSMATGNFLQGASVRGWVDNTYGFEGTVFFADVDATVAGSTETQVFDMLVWDIKGMYALKKAENSKFYVGAHYGQGDVEVFTQDIDIRIFGPLAGAEWNFTELPELGFNFEVGYQFTDFDAENVVDVDLQGVTVGAGIHYYF